MKLIREIRILPGYDKRSANPHENYGVHGCELVFYIHDVHKSKTAQFKCYTDWLPLNVQKERMGKDVTRMYPDVCQVVTGEQPMAADLGYHSPKPLYKGQTKMECDLSKRGYCYYDGSGLGAERVRNIMLKEGDEGVWRELENYWHEIFENEEHEVQFGELMTAFSDALKGKDD